MANQVRAGVHNALPYLVVDDKHWHVHMGEMNYVSLVLPFSSNLVTNSIFFQTATSKYVHIEPMVQANGPMTFKLYENAFVLPDSRGTYVQNFNMNRNFTTSNQTAFYLNPSSYTIAGFNLIYDSLLVGETGGGLGINTKESIGGDTNAIFALKESCGYLITMQNTAATAVQAHFYCSFYEE